ncbi:14804_t:CDS:2 [Cetraspora pellucida]|uniref:14804_t:CDS:1 n=1 Tax=Cetraspora pellucida TaxID=1433469 RepID=A0ACA9M3H3_9GLOM|nr:14804_t:CDS:2 [Cetraspora pellucida]
MCPIALSKTSALGLYSNGLVIGFGLFCEGENNVEGEENNKSKGEDIFSRSESDFDDELNAENVTDNEVLNMDLINIDEVM